MHSLLRFRPREAAYTCWSTASGARVNNWGTRIDLVLVSTAGGGASLAAACTAADIMPEVSCQSSDCSSSACFHGFTCFHFPSARYWVL